LLQTDNFFINNNLIYTTIWNYRTIKDWIRIWIKRIFKCKS